MKQRDAVFNAVINVVGESEGKYDITKEQREEVIMVVTEGILQGKVDFSDSAKAKYSTPEKVKSYTSGLVSNWLRKDTRLNGGEKYVPKNPGSRTGMGDPQIKALRALLRQQHDSETVAKINSAIETRKQELNADKHKPVDVSCLDPAFLEEIGYQQ